VLETGDLDLAHPATQAWLRGRRPTKPRTPAPRRIRPHWLEWSLAEVLELLEFPFGMVEPIGSITLAELVTRIRAAGAENVVLSTDLGQPGNPVPAVGFASGVQRLLDAGVTQREIDLMIRRNPARLLNLDP
jgi:hypothetical protein